MAALQRVAQSSVSTTASSYGSCKGGGGVLSPSAVEMAVPDRFPAGLRVLVVDDDTTCLRILELMLLRCLYQVTTCSEATVALNLLRERKDCFDVVLSDVHMPDMDGFKLLEHIGLEMDLPVIMMSADGRTSVVMRGIRHGACDFLIKPVREAELKNIWQHVVRKKWNGSKELEHSGSLEDNDPHKRGNNDIEYTSSVNEGSEVSLKGQKKRINAKEDDDGDTENDDMSTSKKPRVVWSVELHQQFVTAVNQLGLDKAVPKRILEMMNVPGLTRENKFRLYLKRLNGVAQQQSGIANAFCGPADSNGKLGSLSRFDFQTLATSGQIPPQTLAALQAELLGQPAGNLVPAMDQPALLHASLQGAKHPPVEHGVPFVQPFIKSQSNVSKQFPQPVISAEDVSPGFGQWRSNNCSTVAPSNYHGGSSVQNSNFLMGVVQQEQRQHDRTQQQSALIEPCRSFNVQPSCLVVPSQSSTGFQAGNSPASFNQSSSFNKSTVIDYSLLSDQSNNSLNIGHIPTGNLKITSTLGGYSAPGSISPTSCILNTDNNSTSYQNSAATFSDSRELPGVLHNTSNSQGFYVDKSGEMLDQGPLRNLGFVGKETCIPSRFAVDDFESQMSNLNRGRIQVENSGALVKQEPIVDYVDNEKLGIPILQQYSSSVYFVVSRCLLISMTRTDCFTLSKCSVEIAVEVCVLFLRLDLIDVPAPDSGAERPLASETLEKLRTNVGEYQCRLACILHRPLAGCITHPASKNTQDFALAEMKKSVQKLGSSTEKFGDPTLMRFLIARSMDPDKAAKMFVQWHKWRASFVPNGFVSDGEVKDQLADRKIFLQGLSKDGYPVMVVKASKHCPSKDQLQFKKFVVHLLDKTIASSFRGKEIGNEKMIVILDLQQLSYKNVDARGFITGFQFLQSYYPERLAKLFILSMPWFFVSVWRMISRFLEKATQEKIVIVSNEEGTKNFRKEIGEETLPEEYGGRAKLVLLQDVTPLSGRSRVSVSKSRPGPFTVRMSLQETGPSVAVVGVTGAVGQEFLSVLQDRDFPFRSIKMLASKRSAGQNLKFLGENYVVEELTHDSFDGVEIALFSAGGSISKEFGPVAVERGTIVVDNSSAFRMQNDVPLVVPEVNPEAMEGIKVGNGKGALIANPNCSTIICLMAVTPLHRHSKVKRMVVSTYQAASGAGAAAMRELELQTQEVLEGKPPTTKIFSRQYAFNLFSHNSAVLSNGYNEEEMKLVKETRKIWSDNDVKVTATCIRVPVMRAHAESINLQFENQLDEDTAREILKKAPGLVVIDDRTANNFPTPLEVSNKDDVAVGRIRRDVSQEGNYGLDIFVCGDQIRKGAALNAVQIAEIKCDEFIVTEFNLYL
ncbi:hypothetical protein DVH24_007612 [Malus domestica]|uniref:aspartate-semialdehyde dehydrogenase n=1 Tax=Malus domestica TaxID=3750 RepID=A0A498HFV3_MALDO|nr:hypothetical protein DVH24_007612 [Malus domestica]